MQYDSGRGNGDDLFHATGRESGRRERDYMAAVDPGLENRGSVSDDEPRPSVGGFIDSGARKRRRVTDFSRVGVRKSRELTFERSEDWDLIRSVITHPKIWPHVSDDSTPPWEEWQPVIADSVWYVVVRDGEEVLGVFTMVRHNAICWEVHTCLLPSAWGRTLEAARQMAEWAFANMECLRIITNVPAYNRLALRFAERAGMTQFGVNEKSYLKDGKLWDQFCLGLSKEP